MYVLAYFDIRVVGCLCGRAVYNAYLCISKSGIVSGLRNYEMNYCMVLNLDGPQIRPNIDCPGKSSGVGDLARLTTDSNQVDAKDFEIRATLLSDSFGAFANDTLRCSVCTEEIFAGDLFCQECGAAQTPANEKSARAADSAPVEYSPVADSNDSFADKFIEIVSSKPKLIASVSAALIAGLIGFVMLATFISLPNELSNALKENQLNKATELAEKLMLSRFGTLSGNDAEIYSLAFHRRAQVFAGNRNFKMAFADLAKVLPSYSQIAQVEQLKPAYALLVCQPVPAQASVIDPDGQTDARSSSNSITAAGTSRISALPSRASTDGASVKNAIGKNSTTSSHARASNVPQAEDTAEHPTNSSKEEVNSDTEEADMAAYNRRLAEYFSHAAPRDTNGSAAKDPPSFSEWVQSGKTDF